MQKVNFETGGIFGWNTYGLKRTGCFNCPVSCMEHYDVPGFGPTITSCIMYSNLTWGLQNADPKLWYELNCICAVG